jgi:hypothetical protein
MSHTTAPERLAYDDLATLEEMYGDCLAAGLNLTGSHPAAPPPAASPVRPAQPAIEVPVETALMASALHLHLT